MIILNPTQTGGVKMTRDPKNRLLTRKNGKIVFYFFYRQKAPKSPVCLGLTKEAMRNSV